MKTPAAAKPATKASTPLESAPDPELAALRDDLSARLKAVVAEIRRRRTADMIPVGTKARLLRGKHAGQAGVVIVPGRRRCMLQFEGVLRPSMVQVRDLEVVKDEPKVPPRKAS